MRTEDLKKDSLEKVLLEPFGKLPVNGMTEEDSRFMITISLVPEKNVDGLYQEIKKQCWQLEAMKKRLKNTLTISVDKRIQIFLIHLLNSNIGRLTVYLLYLQYWGKKNKIKDISWEHFTSRIFPMGFPDTDGFRILWQRQKVDGKNMIDIIYAQESIIF